MKNSDEGGPGDRAFDRNGLINMKLIDVGTDVESHGGVAGRGRVRAF